MCVRQRIVVWMPWSVMKFISGFLILLVLLVPYGNQWVSDAPGTSSRSDAGPANIMVVNAGGRFARACRDGRGRANSPEQATFKIRYRSAVAISAPRPLFAARVLGALPDGQDQYPHQRSKDIFHPPV